jgi:hypothetical protein
MSSDNYPLRKLRNDITKSGYGFTMTRKQLPLSSPENYNISADSEAIPPMSKWFLQHVKTDHERLHERTKERDELTKRVEMLERRAEEDKSIVNKWEACDRVVQGKSHFFDSLEYCTHLFIFLSFK